VPKKVEQITDYLFQDTCKSNKYEMIHRSLVNTAEISPEIAEVNQTKVEKNIGRNGFSTFKKKIG